MTPAAATRALLARRAGGLPAARGALVAVVLLALVAAPPLPQGHRASLGSRPAGAALEPDAVRAAYLSYFGVGDLAIRTRVLRMVEQSELNAVVIDVKGDRGFLPYASEIELARATGASAGPVRLGQLDDLLAQFRRGGVYAIARVVVFKDDVVARRRPEWALVDARTGRPWTDNEGLAWIDPFREEAWAYPIAVAREVALKGFDEVQLDYLRFPSDGALGAIRYSRPNTEANRVAAISAFLGRARQALAGTRAALAVDVLAYTAFNADDTGVGQRIEDLAPLVDYLCPMAYPSAYHLGIPGHRNPVAEPYETVFETVRRARQRTAGSPVRVRPWLQDFRDYAFDRRPFGVAEVRAQITAAEAAGAAGWMLWNARNVYTSEALRPPDDRRGR